MSRATLTLASVVLGVSCLVVIVRAQDASTDEPRRLPGDDRATLSDSEPTPAPSRYTELGSPPNEPTPAIRRSEFQTGATTPEDRSSIPSAVKRPRVADRLQQVRETTNGPLSGKPAPRGTAVLGPVTTDPTDLRSPRLAEQPQGPESISRRGTSNPASVADDEPRSGGSILKKSDSGDANGDRSTARRLLRTPSKPTAVVAPNSTLVPTPSATSAKSPAQVEKPQAVLQSRGPTLRLETHGPRALKVGTESTYMIRVHNDGDIEANDVFVRAGLPISAKVVAEGSSADAAQVSDSPNEQRFVWTIVRLAPHATESLTMRVTPTDSKRIDLFVDWTTRPVSAMAQVEVQQPQLEMSVFGPKDIAYGEVAKYTIRLTNPGNGDAEDVTIDFGYGQDKLEPRHIGTLAAGKQQEISLELTARQAGALPVVATATAAGGLSTEASQEVLVRRASLEAAVSGDAAIFAGSPANYRVVIRNAGNAPANQVTALVSLPEGSQIVQLGDEAKQAENGLNWNIGVLPPNGERTLDLQCLLTAAGDNAVRVNVVGASDLATTGTFVTRVEALADLKLTVNDPQGPVAVGQDALYEIHISNRGTKAATKINVVGQFSPGIEPVEATGAQAELVPGQVLFQPISRIDPGQEVTLIVRARAANQGTKRFRVEVSSEELDVQLVAQETTHFFTDSSHKTGTAKMSNTKAETIKR